jgi:lipopolysaccharide/colanic/teichoic acid biosynthesis glycosyltransferase
MYAIETKAGHPTTARTTSHRHSVASRAATLDEVVEKEVVVDGSKEFSAESSPAELRMPLWKRGLDLTLLALTLPLTLSVAIPIAIYIKLVSPGPIFFTQERVGLGCRRFRMFKFRSMHNGVATVTHQQHLAQLMEGDVPMRKMDKQDPRLIPLGSIIRACGLDELPQLLNVLRGEMSIVGPRPCTPYEFERYEAWQKERFNGLPGLTGLWQVCGKNSTTFKRMIELDIAYLREKSLWLDLSIMVRTVPAILAQVLAKDATPAAAASDKKSNVRIDNARSSKTYEEQGTPEGRSRGVRVLGAQPNP